MLKSRSGVGYLFWDRFRCLAKRIHLESEIIPPVCVSVKFIACTCIVDGTLFAVPASHFERDLKQFSEETFNEMVRDCIDKEMKLNKFISVR